MMRSRAAFKELTGKAAIFISSPEIVNLKTRSDMGSIDGNLALWKGYVIKSH